MATRSNIIVEVDGEFNVIYCHWDGHIESVGRTLRDNFGTQELAESIVALGDCSTIADAVDIDGIEAYHRDKGENWVDVKPAVYEDLGAALADSGEQYVYAFIDGAWAVWRNNTWTKL